MASNYNLKRNSARGVRMDSGKKYRSKTPNPPLRPRSQSQSTQKPHKTPKRLLSYRARKDSDSHKEIEEELPDYIKATTPQPHMRLFHAQSQQQTPPLPKRSKSDEQHTTIPSFKPVSSNPSSSMYNFVKTQFEPNIIPMIHDELPAHHQDNDFNANKIHSIPKPLSVRRPLSARNDRQPEFGSLLSPKQMQETILSHYNQSELSPSDKNKKQKIGFFKKKISKKQQHNFRARSRSNSKPFNDEDEEIKSNKSKKAIFKPFAPPNSTPSGQWNAQHQNQQNFVQILPMQNVNEQSVRNRSNSANNQKSAKINIIKPYPMSNNDDEFLDDLEVQKRSFAYNQSLKTKEANNNDQQRALDKVRFQMDALDFNFNSLQMKSDKDIRQITAKVHRVEHDMKTQNELLHRFNNPTNKGRHQRRNSIFNSLEASIGTVMSNVDSIKNALQTLDLRMSIINQRQHDIFKHIEETKDILEKHQFDEKSTESSNNSHILVLNPLEKDASLSRRASLQSMSEMLRLQSTRSMSIKEEDPLILPTYDDNEDILDSKSATKQKLISHIRPELLLQTEKTVLDHGRSTILPKKRQIQTSDGYSIVIERTQQNEKGQDNKLQSILEQEDDENDSTASELSDIDCDRPRTSLSRRKHKHKRSNASSAISQDLIGHLQSETMIIQNDTSSEDDDDKKKNEQKVQKRKYSESYSLQIEHKHNKTQTHAKPPSIFDGVFAQQRDRKRTESMSYDQIVPNVSYEREVSRSDICNNQKNENNKNQILLSPVDDNDDSISDLSEDSMSDLSQENDKKQQQKDKKEKEELPPQNIQLMNCDFILHVVPDSFVKINDFIIGKLSQNASYIVTICNNTKAHDLFFKTCKIFKSNKSKYSKARQLRYFRREQLPQNNNGNDDVIVIDDNFESDDHLAPLEEATFGDINIKKGYHYSGYFVFEAYPFPNVTESEDAMSRRPSNAFNNNAITPHIKPNIVLNAIDEQHKALDFMQFNELKFDAMTPSTVNKYRRQSLSTSSRRTSLRCYNNNNNNKDNEPSVTTLLDRALDEELQNNKTVNLPWNDDLDDLIDVVIGWNMKINGSFKCYLQFNEYSQPSYYHKQLANLKSLRDFCEEGSDELKLISQSTNNGMLTAGVKINEKHSAHPQMVFTINHSPKENRETTFDID